jgi:hypothetical protein
MSRDAPDADFAGYPAGRTPDIRFRPDTGYPAGFSTQQLSVKNNMK